jgi:hypothetical protein
MTTETFSRIPNEFQIHDHCLMDGSVRPSMVDHLYFSARTNLEWSGVLE